MSAVLDRHEGRHINLFGRDYRWHQTPQVNLSGKRRRVTWRWSLLAERDDERHERTTATHGRSVPVDGQR